jgi:hypothetical protein
MTSFTDTLIRVSDDNRVRELSDYERGEVGRRFAPIREALRRNAETASAGTGTLAIY